MFEDFGAENAVKGVGREGQAGCVARDGADTVEGELRLLEVQGGDLVEVLGEQAAEVAVSRADVEYGAAAGGQ
jgi:hypothetical protein